MRFSVLVVFSVAMVGRANGAGALSGAWLFGNYEPEPKAGVVTVSARCWNGGVDFSLTEVDGKITGAARWIEPTRGVAPTSTTDETEELTGTREGDHVLITGRHTVIVRNFADRSMPDRNQKKTVTTIKYDLRTNPKTGHLVGTRDGKRFWLARFRTRSGDCGSPPP